MNTLQLFATLLIVQLFWSFSVALIVPSMPNSSSNDVLYFIKSNNLIQLPELQSSIDQGLNDQSNIPVLETGALIFYASATIINLMVNFFTAIPQMVVLVVHLIFSITPFPVAMVSIIERWIFGIVTILYAIALFAFLTGTRTNLTGGGIF